MVTSTPATDAPAWSRRRARLVAGGLYLGLSLALWWNVWTSSPTTTTICGCGDSAFTLWFQTFAAHALAHGSNPFFTTLLWHPHGVNVLDDASQLGLGIPMAPVTWLVGAVASMNLALVASTFLSAGAMYLLLEHWELWRPGAFVGGLLYGFSPMLLTNLAEARLIVTMLVLPPLIVWVAPSARANASRSSTTSIAKIFEAPAILAAMTAARPTAPTPNMAMDWPARTPREFSTAPAPVCNPHPNGPSNSSVASLRTLMALRSLAMAWVAKELWPKKLPCTAAPSLTSVVDPSSRLPEKQTAATS